MADSTLTAIQTKVRRLTRNLSTAQLPDATLNEYINTFVLYDFPEHIRLFSLKRKFSFYTSPFIDTYETNTTDPTNPLYDFKNLYITVHPPVFIAGREVWYTQSREQFYNWYPINSQKKQIHTGDNVTVLFSGTLGDVPILRNEVLFSSIDANNNGLALYDEVGDGNLTGNGNGTIDYITGQYTITFSSAPATSQPIYSQTKPYNAALPVAMLYFNNQFILRPIPDQPYKVDIDAYVRPSEILAGQSPEESQWWQYIAYGAAKKIFEDKLDMESVQAIMPEFKNQEDLVLRKTIVQRGNMRASSPFTEARSGYNRWPFNNNDVY